MANKTSKYNFNLPTVKDQNWGGLINENWETADNALQAIHNDIKTVEDSVHQLTIESHQPIVDTYTINNVSYTYAWLSGDTNHNFFLASPYPTLEWKEDDITSPTIFCRTLDVTPTNITEDGQYELIIDTNTTIKISAAAWNARMQDAILYNEITPYSYFRIMNAHNGEGIGAETPYNQSWTVTSIMVATKEANNTIFSPLFERGAFWYEPSYHSWTEQNGEVPANHDYIEWLLKNGETPPVRIVNDLGLLEVRGTTILYNVPDTVTNAIYTLELENWPEAPSSVVPNCIVDIFSLNSDRYYTWRPKVQYTTIKRAGQRWALQFNLIARSGRDPLTTGEDATKLWTSDIIRVTRFVTYDNHNEPYLRKADNTNYGSLKIGFDNNPDYNYATEIINNRNYALKLTNSIEEVKDGHGYVHVPWPTLQNGEGIQIETIPEKSFDEHQAAQDPINIISLKVPTVDTLGGVKYETFSSEEQPIAPDGNPITVNTIATPVKGTSDGHMYVTVPWTNRNNNYISNVKLEIEPISGVLTATMTKDGDQQIISRVNLPLSTLITNIEYVEYTDPQPAPGEDERVYPYLRIYYYSGQFADIPLENLLVGLASESWVGEHYIHNAIISDNATNSTAIVASTTTPHINMIRGMQSETETSNIVAASIPIVGTNKITVTGEINNTLKIAHGGTTNANFTSATKSQALDFNSTFDVADMQVDDYGHVITGGITKYSTPTIDTAAPIILSKTGNTYTIKHDTIHIEVENTDALNYLSSVETDDCGHITKYTQGTIGNGILTLKAGNGLTATNTTFQANQTTDTTWTIAHASSGGASDIISTAKQFVSGITFDTFGHVTKASTNTITNSSGITLSTDTNNDIIIGHTAYRGSQIAANIYGQTTPVTINYSTDNTFNVLNLSVETLGHVTTATSNVITIPKLTIQGSNGLTASITNNTITVTGITASSNSNGMMSSIDYNMLHNLQSCAPNDITSAAWDTATAGSIADKAWVAKYVQTHGSGGSTADYLTLSGGVLNDQATITFVNGNNSAIYSCNSIKTSNGQTGELKLPFAVTGTLITKEQCDNSYLSLSQGGAVQGALRIAKTLQLLKDTDTPPSITGLPTAPSGYNNISGVYTTSNLRFNPPSSGIYAYPYQNYLLSALVLATWKGDYNTTTHNSFLQYCVKSDITKSNWDIATAGEIADKQWVSSYVTQHSGSTNIDEGTWTV